MKWWLVMVALCCATSAAALPFGRSRFIGRAIFQPAVPVAPATMSPTATGTITNTPTRTSTVTHTGTVTQTPTASLTPTVTNTPLATATATVTRTFTATATFTPSRTATTTPIDTNTPVVTATATHTGTITHTATRTNTATVTNTPLVAPTATATVTATPTQAVDFPFTATCTTSGNCTTLGRNSPAYPPGGATIVDNNLLNLQRSLVGMSNYAHDMAGIRFDTAAIPDTATITACKLRIRTSTEAILNADMRSITMAWATALSGWTSADYDVTAGTTAHAGTPLTTITTSTTFTFTLAACTNINKTGFTGLKLWISGGQPTGQNNTNFLTTGGVPPQLLVTFQ